MKVRGRVGGMVRFPNHPDHEGHLGLEGGEDVYVMRDTFRSPTEAARWCERIESGELRPRLRSFGPLLTPYEGPFWSEPEVAVLDEWGSVVKQWRLIDGKWTEEAS